MDLPVYSTLCGSRDGGHLHTFMITLQEPAHGPSMPSALLLFY